MPIKIKNPAAPVYSGEVVYDTPGTFSWTAPVGVTSVCVVAIGGGGGGESENRSGGHSGGGGGLGYKNNITVVPGNNYTVVVGGGGATSTLGPAGNGGDSYFINTSTVKGGGGQGGEEGRQAYGGSYVGTGGGNGGKSGAAHTSSSDSNGAGGAGGYTGTGGQGGNINTNNATAGAGGAGGGGGAGGSSDAAGAGGGVGLFGQGANGAAGAYNGSNATGGKGGSGGGDALTFDGGIEITRGGLYGGGGGGAEYSYENGPGGDGAVRIIWGSGKAFPSTNVGLDTTPEYVKDKEISNAALSSLAILEIRTNLKSIWTGFKLNEIDKLYCLDSSQILHYDLVTLANQTQLYAHNLSDWGDGLFVGNDYVVALIFDTLVKVDKATGELLWSVTVDDAATGESFKKNYIYANKKDDLYIMTNDGTTSTSGGVYRFDKDGNKTTKKNWDELNPSGTLVGIEGSSVFFYSSVYNKFFIHETSFDADTFVVITAETGNQVGGAGNANCIELPDGDVIYSRGSSVYRYTGLGVNDVITQVWYQSGGSYTTDYNANCLSTDQLYVYSYAQNSGSTASVTRHAVTKIDMDGALIKSDYWALAGEQSIAIYCDRNGQLYIVNGYGSKASLFPLTEDVTGFAFSLSPLQQDGYTYGYFMAQQAPHFVKLS